jgi:HK97 family phage major capsid protein
MPTELEIKSAIDQLTADYNRSAEALKGIPEMEAKLATLGTQMAEIAANQKKQAEQKAMFAQDFGGKEVDARLALGAYIKGLVASALVNTREPDMGLGRLKLDNPAICKAYGYVGAEREMAEFMIQKAAVFESASLDTAGGVFISNEVLGSEWVKKLRPNERTIFNAGARYSELPAGTGNLTIPRQTSLATVGNVSENGQLICTGINWEFISAVPYRVGATGLLSKRLIFQASEYADIFQSEILYSLWRQVQNSALYGTGSSGAPRGMFYDPGVSKVYLANSGSTTAGTAGKIGTYLDANLMEDILAQANGRTENFSIIARPEVARNMKNSVINGNGTFSLLPEGTLASDENLKKAMGSDRQVLRLTDLRTAQTVGSSTDCADTFFGQFDNIVVYAWGGVQVKVSDTAVVQGQSAFERNALALAGDLDYTPIIRNPAELFVALDLRTTSASTI